MSDDRRGEPAPGARTEPDRLRRGPDVKRRIAVITTSRADYGHLYWVLHDLREHPDVDLRLVAIGAHLAPEFGRTAGEIERDGFKIDETVECLLSSDTDVGAAKTIGVAVLGLAEVLGRVRPDILLLIADRYELLAPAAVALALRIPIAHIEGGEVSEGAIDDAVRNAITKMSHLHFTTTETARRRVLAMGEEAWRVHRTGAPSLDHLRRRPLPGRADVEAALGLDLGRPTVLVSYHPVTLHEDATVETNALLAAMGSVTEKRQVVFCFPNSDAGSRSIVERVRAFCAARPGTRLFTNVPHLLYWGLLGCVDLLVGNSSSGLMETPSLVVPTVDVGIRQRGRERARNVIDAEPEAGAILAAISRAGDPTFRAGLAGLDSPYGDGHAAERIVAVLAKAPPRDRLLFKRPSPLPVGEQGAA